MTSKKLRLEVTDCHGCYAAFTGAITGEEVVRTNRGSVSRLQVGLHAGLTGGTARVFVVPLTSRDTALTSRVVRDMGKTVHTEVL